jgi:hypothetical protein
MEYGNATPKIQRLKDFGLVAALVSCDFVIQKTERNFKTVYFLFENTPAIEKRISEYWSNTLSVPARLYFDNTKMLKSRIYDEVDHGA